MIPLAMHNQKYAIYVEKWNPMKSNVIETMLSSIKGGRDRDECIAS